MRESIAGAWLYSVVLIFVVILVAFISIALNYNKTYKLKTTVVNLIEQNQGVNNQTIASIGQYLKANGYMNGKVCNDVIGNEKTYVGINNGIATFVLDKTDSHTTNYPQQVCITRDMYKSSNPGANQLDYYYTAHMFFSFSLPVFGELFKFNVAGTTNSIYYPVDNYSGGSWDTAN